MIPIQIGKQKQHPSRRVLRGLLWAVALAALAWAVTAFLFNRITRFVPPEGATPRLAIESAGRRTQLGASSLEWQGTARGFGETGIWTLRLRGEPYALGHVHGMLGDRLIMAVDDHMFDMMAHFMPSSTKRWLALKAVRWRYRGLADSMPPARRLELAGLAAAFTARHRDVIPTYQRLGLRPGYVRRSPHHRPQLRLRGRRDLRP